jgi:3-phenylpropionate/cinnamic acid dioxygenase small subunit
MLGSGEGTVRLQPDNVADRLEILEVLARYAHALDEKDWNVLAEVFTSDATIDLTSSGGIRCTARQFRTWAPEALGRFSETQHMLGQSEFAFEPDGSATVKTYQYNPMAWKSDDGAEHLFVVGGYYRDRLVRTPDGWRISNRNWHKQWVQGQLPDLPPAPPRAI